MISKGYRITSAEQSAAVIDAALAHQGPALIEATVDANEPLLPPKRIAKHADNLDKALRKGTPGADQIRRALQDEPARTLLQE